MSEESLGPVTDLAVKHRAYIDGSFSGINGVRFIVRRDGSITIPDIMNVGERKALEEAINPFSKKGHKMSDSIQGPACSHMMVLYFEFLDGVHTAGYWACKNCHAQFIPNGVLTHQKSINAELDRKLGAARSFLRQTLEGVGDTRQRIAEFLNNRETIEEFDPAKPIAAKDIAGTDFDDYRDD